MTNETLLRSRVSFVYSERKGLIFGDSIRIRKVSEAIDKANFQILKIRLPGINRNYISTYDGLKNIFLNIFPLHKSNVFSSGFNRESVVRSLEFNVGLNLLIRNFKKFRPKVILAEMSIAGWVASLAAKRLSIPCIIDVHGLAFAEAKSREYKNWQLLMNIEKEAFQNCDHLIVVSKKMRAYLLRAFVPDKKMTVVSNGSDTQQSVAKYECPLKIIYAGTFLHWEKVDDFLNIAKQADQNIFKFYLAGEGPLKDHLIRRIGEERIPVRYLGYIPTQKIHSVFAKMQVGIAPSTKDLARQVASPIKVFDYMASGLPIITPKIGDWGDIVEKENCGMALSDDNIESYLIALHALAQENIWISKSNNAIKSIKEKHNWTRTLEPVIGLLLEYTK